MKGGGDKRFDGEGCRRFDDGGRDVKRSSDGIFKGINSFVKDERRRGFNDEGRKNIGRNRNWIF